MSQRLPIVLVWAALLAPLQFAGATTTSTFTASTSSTTGVKTTASSSGGGSSSLEVNSGQSVTLTCEAEGSSQRPTVTLSRDSTYYNELTSQRTQVGSHGARAVATRNMACRDTGYYKCQTFDFVSGVLSRRLLVLVKCAPQLQDSGTLKKQVSYTGSGTSLAVPIYGYPRPSSFSLYSRRGGRRTRLLPSKYRIAYRAIDTLLGVVDIEFLGLGSDDIGEIEVVIINGVSLGLTYLLELIEDETGIDLPVSAIVGIVVGVLVLVCMLIICIVMGG